jgi:hypothetical protein
MHRSQLAEQRGSWRNCREYKFALATSKEDEVRLRQTEALGFGFQKTCEDEVT